MSVPVGLFRVSAMSVGIIVFVGVRLGKASGRQVDGARPAFRLFEDFFGHFPFFRRFFRPLLVEMVLHHFRQGFQKDLERFPVVGDFFRFVMPVGAFADVGDRPLDVFGDFVGIARFAEFELFGLVFEMDRDVALSKERIEDGIAFDFDPVDGMERDVGDVAGEHVPIEIHDSLVGNEPDVVVPIEHRVEQVEVDGGQISLEIRERHEFAEGEGIEVVEKRRQESSEKQDEENPVDDERHVAVAHEKEFRVFGNVFREKEFVEFVHVGFYGLSVGKSACQGVSV